MAPEQEKNITVETKISQEKQTNCLACSKPIIKLKRYYRNGKFYCNKKCWRNYIKKVTDKKDSAT